MQSCIVWCTVLRNPHEMSLRCNQPINEWQQQQENVAMLHVLHAVHVPQHESERGERLDVGTPFDRGEPQRTLSRVDDVFLQGDVVDRSTNVHRPTKPS